MFRGGVSVPRGNFAFPIETEAFSSVERRAVEYFDFSYNFTVTEKFVGQLFFLYRARRIVRRYRDLISIGEQRGNKFSI